jgi:RND family efflux transporter MFP subunit
MFNHLKCAMAGVRISCFILGAIGATSCIVPTGALAQAQSAEPPTKRLILSDKYQASLGIQVVTVKAAAAGQILASASVVTPPGKEFTVSAPYPGQLTRLVVGVGDTVKAGAPLAQFTSPMLGDARRLLSEANIDYKNASAAVQRDQAMFEDGIIAEVRLQLSRTKQETTLAQLHARESELNAAGLRFDGTIGAGYSTGTLTAPFAGQILEAFASVGQRVDAGAVLFKLADSSQLQLDLKLSSHKASQLEIGDEVSISTRNAKAKIIGISRAVDAGQSARARATVLNRGSLNLGEFVPVTVHARGKYSAAVQDSHWLVPTRAITQWQGKPWIFVSNPQGFLAQSVTVNSSSDDLSLIAVSLPAGAKVAITGIASLSALLQKDE